VLTRLGKFEVVRLLAQGSMGEVYLGRDPIIGREVALKVIHKATGMSPGARERFATEARAAGALNHPNIVTIHEMGEEQGVLYLAMELVKGEDLGTLIHAGTLMPRDALEVLAQVCDGLAAAHRHEVLHRDIKPSNIRVLWDGQHLQAKVLDFGVAKVMNSDHTDEGTVLGTVNYMAPEYLESGLSDARSDLFAVGVLLYEALAGFPPFDGPTPGSVIYRLLHDAPPPLPPLAFRGISRDVQALLARALAKDPANRFQTAEALSTVLRAARDPAWHWDQEHPTGTLKIRPQPVGGGPRPAASPWAMPVVPTSQHLVGPAGLSSRGGGAPIPALQRERAAEPEAEPLGRVEVRKDLLETSVHQLLQALELDPANARAQAMLMVTYYRLGHAEALMQELHQAQRRGIRPADLLAMPRCSQMVDEESRAHRLPAAAHEAFMDLLAQRPSRD